MNKYYYNITIAFESLLSNKLKSILTALGIIFGVAAVISMLAIGKGAQQEILEQMKLVGVNNIIITPITNQKTNDSENQEESEKEKNKFSRGLTLLDGQAIQSEIPTILRVTPEITLNTFVLLDGKRTPAKLQGVSNSYFKLFNLNLGEGGFYSTEQEESGSGVCIIGENIRSRFFSQVNPIGQYIKCGNVWLKIIGVLAKSSISVSGFQNSGVNVYNDNIYIPSKTMLLRYKNRALVTQKAFSQDNNQEKKEKKNYNQLDRLIVQVRETEDLSSTVDIISRMLLRRHSGLNDFEITVPELLLKQQQRTKDIFNIVLGAIAGISLLVGGIGIMNIMFASVMERIKEIGTRMAIGATKTDIVVQFLAEAVLISVSGGLIGVFLGIALSKLITYFADINTIVSPLSVLIAFVLSAGVGIIFGITPARRASEKDPIESLHYE